MKILEVLEQPDLDLLFKKQKVRCYEFILAWKKITKTNLAANFAANFNSYLTSTAFKAEEFRKIILENPKLIQKYNRMMNAKEAFENAGGSYPENY